MTPYARLLVRPSDPDAVISARFQQLARTLHPDARPDSRPGEGWYELTAAYAVIRTAPGREALARAVKLDARRCAVCAGAGVVGSRSAGSKVRLCATCKGEGRWT